MNAFSKSALLVVLLTRECCAGPSETAAPAPAGPATSAAPPSGTILFFGTIADGPGVSLEEAYPVLLRQRVDSLHLPYAVVNAGLLGETTAGSRLRVGGVLRRRPVRVVVVGLGGNDGRRGLPLQATRRNLQALIDTVRRNAPHASVLLAGMSLPAVRSQYSAGFKQLYAETARHNHLVLIPFLSPAGRRASTTPAMAKTATQTLWHTIAPLL